MPRKLNEYQLFIKEYRQRHPEMHQTDVIKYGSAEWRKITGKKKQPKRTKAQKKTKSGGFLLPLAGAIGTSLLYDHAVKPAVKSIFGKKNKKKPKKKGGLIYGVPQRMIRY